MARSWGRSSEKFLHGTKQKDSDGRFLEDVDGIPYDGMFIFEDVAYGFIPNEAGAAFGHGAAQQARRIRPVAKQVFASHAYFARHPDIFVRRDSATTSPPPGSITRSSCAPNWAGAAAPCRSIWRRWRFTRTIFSGNITRQPMMSDVEYRADKDGYPVADQIMLQGVCLPCHPTMTAEDCAYLYGVLDDFVKQQRGKN